MLVSCRQTCHRWNELFSRMEKLLSTFGKFSLLRSEVLLRPEQLPIFAGQIVCRTYSLLIIRQSLLQQMNKQSFIAIDFETATGKRSSICEVGICVVRDGDILETKSWFVQPEDNTYAYWNTQVHGIRPEDTSSAPFFPEVWMEIEREYLGQYDTLVAHNAPFDRSCLEHAAQLYGITLGELQWDCSLKIARQIYDFKSNSLAFLCDQLAIERGTHHRAGDDAEMCARLYLREQADARNSRR